jgi:soluble lytic murein transglycosylase
METALIALASATRLPGLSLRLGAAITSANGKLYDAALYPLPRWEPDNGYEVDKALIYALVRQESQFNTAARSPAGAAGLMQLMPRTASYMTGRDFSQNNDTALNDPELNLTIGQKYVQHLLGQENIDNNLFFMLAAYNGGPTQARQWQRELEYGDDPLLFIETVTASETRNFIERVLANYWIYRQQLGAKTPSLEAVAAGQWPIYAPPHRLDVVRVANNITNPVN